MLVADLFTSLNSAFPFLDAASWDPVGLQLGDPQRDVGRVGVTHEITDDVVESALSGEITTIVTYHPLLFAPTTAIVAGSGSSGRALRLLESGVAVLVVHTAMDAASNGTADALLRAIGVEVAGSFGATDPGSTNHIGRYGELRKAATVAEVAKVVSSLLMASVRIAGDTGAMAESIAVVPGSGGSFIDEATAVADIYVTGDVSHHQARLGTDMGLAIVDAGHIPTERPGVEHLYDAVRDFVPDAVFIASDPHPWEDVPWKT